MNYWGLLLVLTFLRASTSQLQNMGLQSKATPSFVILGTAKGGTTDIWHLVHKFYYGFAQFHPKDPFQRIQTKKELNFFNPSLCELCSPMQFRSFFRCPSLVINNPKENEPSLMKRCSQWLLNNKIDAPEYTITASPSLMYEYVNASLVLGKLANQSTFTPLFLILLRNPITRIQSLYNHWMIQEGVNGYIWSLDKVLQLELELLSTTESQKFLSIIATSINRMKDDLLLLSSSPSSSSSFSEYNQRIKKDTNRTHFHTIADAYTNLRDYMSNQLEKMSSKFGRLNLRSFGLILDTLYIAQISGWLSMKSSITHLDICGHLLIAKSEYIASNRNYFTYDILYNFFYPNSNHQPNNQSASDNLAVGATSPMASNLAISKKYKSSFTKQQQSSTASVVRLSSFSLSDTKNYRNSKMQHKMLITNESLTSNGGMMEMQNRKTKYLNSTILTEDTMKRLKDFFRVYDVMPVLRYIQQSQCGEIVPSIVMSSSSEQHCSHWWWC